MGNELCFSTNHNKTNRLRRSPQPHATPPVFYAMDLSEYAMKTLNDALGLVMLHMDAHPDPSSDPEDWKIWGQQFLEKKVRSGLSVNIGEDGNRIAAIM